MVINDWIETSRPKTLTASFAPVLIGLALSWHSSPSVLDATIIFITSALIQIGTNFTNDVVDVGKGLDPKDRIGPIRPTHSGKIEISLLKKVTVFTFLLAFLLGSYLVYKGGLAILCIGLAAIASGIFYSLGDKSLSRTGLADLFVFIFFGPVAVMGTQLILAGGAGLEGFISGITPGCISTAILLINNIRDLDHDTIVGRKTIPIRIGERRGKWLYAFLLSSVIVVPVILVGLDDNLSTILLSLVVLPYAISLIIKLFKAKSRDAFVPLLAQTSLCLILYSIFFSVGTIISQ